MADDRDPGTRRPAPHGGGRARPERPRGDAGQLPGDPENLRVNGTSDPDGDVPGRALSRAPGLPGRLPRATRPPAPPHGGIPPAPVPPADGVRLPPAPANGSPLSGAVPTSPRPGVAPSTGPMSLGPAADG